MLKNTQLVDTLHYQKCPSDFQENEVAFFLFFIYFKKALFSIKIQILHWPLK